MEVIDIKYSKKIFAFLDILGFERLVNESRDNPALIGKIVSMLKRSKQMANWSLNTKLTILQVNPNEYMYRAFSDTIIISGPYKSHDDMEFLSAWVMSYQYLMWKEQRIFLRGAIVFGDIYQDEEINFGPALIDAYHIERSATKTVWPRVLIDDSLLDKATDMELERDFFEILRKDDDNLVYLDYLRELFHLVVLGENKRITGSREWDFGKPIKFFEDHVTAILAQVENISKTEISEERERILSKYSELSKYHNSTIDRLCRVIDDILRDSSLIKDFFDEIMKSDKSGPEYKHKYSAEEHPEQSDMINILGTVMNGIILRHQEDISTIEKAYETFCIEMPEELLRLQRSLERSKIDSENINYIKK